MSEVKMEIPMDSRLKLPEGSSFHAKSGQARLDIGKGEEPSTIVVYASCDSLQVRLEYYERKYATYREAYERLQSIFEEERERRPNPVRTFFAGFGIGIVITILGMTIIKNRLKNGN